MLVAVAPAPFVILAGVVSNPCSPVNLPSTTIVSPSILSIVAFATLELSVEVNVTVLPIANRLILFQAGQVLHSVDKVLTGTRRALAFNLWDKEPWSYGQGHFSSEQ